MQHSLFQRRQTGLSLLLAVCLTMLLPERALSEGELPSRSSLEASKRGILIRKLYPMPDVFDWNNHEVSFKECWYEKPAAGGRHNLLCFRLLVDGSTTQELEIQKTSDRSIEFREDGSKGKTLLSGTQINYPLRNFKLKQIRKGMGEIMHWIEIKDPDTKRVNLRIYTMNHTTDLIDRSNVVLTFDDLYSPEE
ncbi:MAG TPA: hypothetical protein PKZ32_13770 [Candidatus Melainabacteria bacterium]|nr:hypothetical protein [Candidatus Melainabacteria bacterium]